MTEQVLATTQHFYKGKNSRYYNRTAKESYKGELV